MIPIHVPSKLTSGEVQLIQAFEVPQGNPAKCAAAYRTAGRQLATRFFSDHSMRNRKIALCMEAGDVDTLGAEFIANAPAGIQLMVACLWTYGLFIGGGEQRDLVLVSQQFYDGGLSDVDEIVILQPVVTRIGFIETALINLQSRVSVRSTSLVSPLLDRRALAILSQRLPFGFRGSVRAFGLKGGDHLASPWTLPACAADAHVPQHVERKMRADHQAAMSM